METILKGDINKYCRDLFPVESIITFKCDLRSISSRKYWVDTRKDAMCIAKDLWSARASSIVTLPEY